MERDLVRRYIQHWNRYEFNIVKQARLRSGALFEFVDKSQLSIRLIILESCSFVDAYLNIAVH